MNINVVIPVVQTSLCNSLLLSMEKNTVLPQRVIIIDNSLHGDYSIPPYKFPIDVHKSVEGKVNESWNLGVSLVDITCDYVSILNDDIVLNKWFFQRVLETFEMYSGSCGVACPRIVDSMEIFGKGKGKRRIKKMGKREGCAMTLKKSCLDAIAPIPSHRIEIFHGDDWYWYWILMNGHLWFKDHGNIVFHHVGSSVLPMGYRSIKKKERNEWHRIMDELGG